MDQLKRWIQFTQPAPGEMFKSGQPVEKLIIRAREEDLQKAQVEPTAFVIDASVQRVPSHIGAASSPAGDRNPGVGVGANYVTRTPEHLVVPVMTLEPNPREVLDRMRGNIDRGHGTKKGKEVWEFSEKPPPSVWAERFELVDVNPYGSPLTEEEIAANREDAERTSTFGREVVPNKADLEKASVTPIGGITPGGYKKVAKDKYVLVEPAKAKSLPHVYHGHTSRLGVQKIANTDDLDKPKVHDKFLQRGHAVIVKGKSTGTLVGYNFQGRPVVQYEGKQRTLQWSDVVPAKEGQSYKAVYEHLKEADAIVHATERQKKITHEVLELKVGTSSAKEYMDWLRERGNEVFLVGGIVRDLVMGTKTGKDASDESIKEHMKDIDIVSTSHPGVGVQMSKAKGGKKLKDNSGWGVVQILDGVGLDVSSIASSAGDDHTERRGVYDHDMEEDTQRRDFTANALFYDVYNDTIIDPTGQGISDAQAKVLRLAPTVENALKNKSLPLRFWKFRTRGWKPEAETLKLMRKMLVDLGKDVEKGGQARVEAKRIIKGGLAKMLGKGNKYEIWKSLKQAMVEDGCGDLYAKYIRPHKKSLVLLSAGGK
jgi:hypothetical protein